MHRRAQVAVAAADLVGVDEVVDDLHRGGRAGTDGPDVLDGRLVAKLPVLGHHVTLQVAA